MFILFVALVAILGFLAYTLILNFVAKIFKVQNATFGNAMKISLLVLIFGNLITYVISIFLNVAVGSWVALISVFLIFHIFSKKYYLTKFGKNILIYLTINLVALIISLAIILPVRFFVLEPFYVSGAAMNPTFADKAYIVLNKFDKNFKRGDVIVFKSPQDSSQYLIKRIIGLPNEKVQIKDGAVYIFNAQNADGLKLGAPYVLTDSVYAAGNNQFTLGQNEYFVLGDNAMVSKDSRSFGPVNANLITGKYWFTPNLLK